MAKAKKKGSGLRVDFTGVEGKRSTLPDDDYLVEVESVEEKEGPSATYLELTLVVQKGEHKGSKIWDRLSLSPGALWRAKSMLEVMGIEIPDGAYEIDPDDLVGTTFMAVTAQEKYKNDEGEKKVAVRMVDFYAASADEDAEEVEEDDEDDKPSKSKKAKAKAKAKDDDDEDEDVEETDDETEAEKKKRIRKERRQARKAGKSKDADEDEDDDEDVKPSKKSKAKAKDDDEDEDEDEDEKPKSKKDKGKKKKKAKVTADSISEMDEEELQAFIEEHELEVDLDDYKTLRKKAAAVTDAAEEADLVESDDD